MLLIQSKLYSFHRLSCLILMRIFALLIGINSSRIALTHPLVLRGIGLGLSYYGSPTLSDQALMPFETLKIGPGDSARSHTANEYIGVKEIEEGIEVYKKLLESLYI